MRKRLCLEACGAAAEDGRVSREFPGNEEGRGDLRLRITGSCMKAVRSGGREQLFAAAGKKVGKLSLSKRSLEEQ